MCQNVYIVGNLFVPQCQTLKSILKMTTSEAVAQPVDEIKFKEYRPLIEKYNQDKLEQIKSFDPEFYKLCLLKLPEQSDLDSKPIDARQFVRTRDLGLLTDSEFEIVNEYTIQDLLAKQLSGELTAETIAKAYIKSAIIAQLATNCVMQFLIPQALEKAKVLDDHLKQTGALIGPMHGVPVSLKEQMGYKGQPTTASYVSLIGNVVDKSSISNQVFDKLGAIFHVRTSQPQCIMHLDTWNNFIGRTRNPASTMLSPGGSSGGESAMVGMHGSVIGVGSDIGGSVRCPAAFANLFGLRPTTKRLSSMNGVSGGKGQESIPATDGPIARSIEELDYFMKTYINEGKPWEYDPMSIPIPWKSPVIPQDKKIKIGVLYDDNLVTPLPAVTRGLKGTVAELLESGRFEIVDLAPYWFTEKEMDAIYTANVTLYTIDGNKQQMELVEPSGEPVLPLTKHFFEFGGGKELSIYENKKLNLLRDATKLAILEKFFSDKAESLNLDFILSPTYSGPSEIPGESFYWGYTSFWNLTDYPNVVFPTKYHQDDKLDVYDENSLKLKQNQYEKKTWFKDDGKTIKYDPKDYIGGPVALQLTGRRFHDEDIVAAVKVISDCLQLSRR